MQMFKLIITHERHELDELIYHFKAESALEALMMYVKHDSAGDSVIEEVKEVGEGMYEVVNTNRRRVVDENPIIEAGDEFWALAKWINETSKGDVGVVSITALD